jgi:hypothetical protein
MASRLTISLDHFEEEPDHYLDYSRSVCIVLHGRVIFAIGRSSRLRLIWVEIANLKLESLLKLGNETLLLLMPRLEATFEDLHGL